MLYRLGCEDPLSSEAVQEAVSKRHFKELPVFETRLFLHRESRVSKLALEKQCPLHHHSSPKNCRHSDLAVPTLDPTLSIKPNQNDPAWQ